MKIKRMIGARIREYVEKSTLCSVGNGPLVARLQQASSSGPPWSHSSCLVRLGFVYAFRTQYICVACRDYGRGRD